MANEQYKGKSHHASLPSEDAPVELEQQITQSIGVLNLMIKYSTSILIQANQDTIWQVLSDVAHWSEWTPTVTKTEVLDQPELRLNRRYKVHQPKLQPVAWTVTVLTSPSSFTWESRLPGILMMAEHTLRPIATNQTELTLTFAFQGFLGTILSSAYGTLTESYINTEAQSLKKKIEG